MYLQRRDFKQNTLKKDKGLQGRLASYESPQWSNRREKELTADLLFCVVNQRQAMKLILKKSYQISFHLILWSQSLKKSALSSFLKYWLLKFFYVWSLTTGLFTITPGILQDCHANTRLFVFVIRVFPISTALFIFTR